ncbi:MAG: tetratricopeptide repeat protein, partial [Deltaproteobacteria bacterium]
MRIVRDRDSSKNSSPCSPPRDSSADRILERGSSESSAASDIGPPRGFTGSEYIIQRFYIFPEERMRNIIITGGLALLLFLAPAGASIGAAAPNPSRYDSRAYTYFLAGYLDSREGNLDAALGSYRKALKYADDEPDIRYEIANVLVKKGRLPEAREELEKALAVDAGHSSSRYLLAGILAASGDREKALAEYDRVLKEDPENDDAYLHVATLYAENGEFSKAEEVLSALIARDP